MYILYVGVIGLAKRAKTSAKTKTKSKPRNTKYRRKQRREEIAGICVCIFGIFIFICLFATSTGEWGVKLKDMIYGALGVLAYPFPFLIVGLGIAIIAKRKRKIKWGQVVLWSFFGLCIVCMYHLLFIKSFEVETFGKYVSTSYETGRITKYGGAGGFAGTLSYLLLKYVGSVGSYLIYIAYIVTVVIIKSRVNLRTVSRDLGDRINEGYREARTSVSTRIAENRERRQLYIDDLTIDEEKIGEDIQILDSQDFRDNQDGEQNEAMPPFLRERKEMDLVEPEPVRSLFAEPEQRPVPGDGENSSVDEKEWEKALADAKEQEESGEAYVPPEKPPYIFPDINLMTRSNNARDFGAESECRENALKLENTLASFGIKAKVMQVSRGPAVTRFELKPPPGVKISRITNLANDIALSLAAPGVRIEAPIPGKAAIGIEVPNRSISVVKLRDIVESGTFSSAKSNLSICLGKDIAGKNVVADLSKMPHMLIAGATGSGKSVCINSLIISLIYKSAPEDVRMIMIDPKRVELNVYNGIPHLLIPVVADAKKAAGALNWAVNEMSKRYQLFSDNKARDIARYNEIAAETEGMEKMPHVVIIIDELADLMAVAATEVEDAICRLAQLARAAGMHLVIATQRPSVDVITGIIKANIPSRAAFAVSSQVDSRTILDTGGAEKLLGRGDMLFHPSGAPKPIRLQGAFITDKEVDAITKFVRNDEAQYDNEIIKNVEAMAAKEKGGASDDDMELDPLVPKAIDVVYDQNQASISMIQRKLRVGYARAARLMDDLERLSIVGPSEGSKPRQIQRTRAEAHRLAEGGDLHAEAAE